MFDKEHPSIYEEQDEFGIQDYRENVDVLFQMNSVKVEMHRVSKNIKGALQGDFLGTKTKYYSDEAETIFINLATSAPKAKKMKEDGYHSRGSVVINAFCRYDINIDDTCQIKFLKNHKYGIKRNDVFRVEIKDTGDYNGQYTFQNFDLKQVN